MYHVLIQHSWNWAPRVAGSYVVTKNGKNAVRASWTKITDITNFSYLGSAGTSTLTTTDVYNLPTGPATFVTPASTTASKGKTFDPGRHQGYAREWIVGYRTQLPGDVTIDGSYIDREYRDRPAQVDTNQIYTTTSTGTVWSGLVDPTINNNYYITNNKWNWFVYQGLEITASKQTKELAIVHDLYLLAGPSCGNVAAERSDGDPRADEVREQRGHWFRARQCDERLYG